MGPLTPWSGFPRYDKLDELIMSSGRKGLYWSPLGEQKKLYTVLWLKGDASTDHAAAEEAAQARGAALVRRAGRYALRVREEHSDQLRVALGYAPGKQYILQGFPVHIDETDVTAVMEALQWPATVLPNRRRVYRGMSEWRVRSCTEPPRDRIALNMGSQRVNLVIKPADRGGTTTTPSEATTQHMGTSSCSRRTTSALGRYH